MVTVFETVLQASTKPAGDPDLPVSSECKSGIRRLRPKCSVGVMEASLTDSGAGSPAADTKNDTPHGSGAAVPVL